MTIHEYLMKSIQDDARRAGERERLLLEARRARRGRRQRLVPAAPARRRTDMGEVIVSEKVALDATMKDPAGDEGFRPVRPQQQRSIKSPITLQENSSESLESGRVMP